MITTDWRPVIELEFVKPRGKDPKPSQKIVFEEFISVKGIKAMGNQVSSEKIKNINSLESLPYTPDSLPDQTEDIEVEDPQTLDNDDDNGQITLEL